MASIFCPDCGAKAAYTLNKPKFCQSCGEKFKETRYKRFRGEYRRNLGTSCCVGEIRLFDRNGKLKNYLWRFV